MTNQTFVDFSQQLTPELYNNLKTALELGKWPNGSELSLEQKELCMQALISYEATNLAEEDRVGHIGLGCKSNGKGYSANG